MSEASHLLWLDLESTGTHSDDPILEIACILTTIDPPWDEISMFSAVVLPTDEAWRDRMNANVVAMHTANGLLSELDLGIAHPLDEVESDLIEWLGSHGLRPHSLILAGVGVSYFDSRLIAEQMPLFARWPQHPRFEVGSIRAALRYAGRPDLVRSTLTYEGGKPHRALADIRDHLAEWRAYGEMIAKIPNGEPDTFGL